MSVSFKIITLILFITSMSIKIASASWGMWSYPNYANQLRQQKQYTTATANNCMVCHHNANK